MKLPPHLLRNTALPAVTIAVWLSLGLTAQQGKAEAQSDPASEVRALRAEVTQLAQQVAALEAVITRTGRIIMVGGTLDQTEMILRARPDTRNQARLGKADAVLEFDRITLVGTDITIDAKSSISLRAATIRFDRQIDAKGMSDVPVRNFKAREN